MASASVAMALHQNIPLVMVGATADNLAVSTPARNYAIGAMAMFWLVERLGNF
jgi:ABC-type sugar transport system substrate-binding protein